MEGCSGDGDGSGDGEVQTHKQLWARRIFSSAGARGARGCYGLVELRNAINPFLAT